MGALGRGLSFLALLALLTGAPLPGVGVDRVAHAAAGVFGGRLIEMLPTGSLIGDGATSVRLYVLMLEPDATPIEGLEAKVTVSGGVPGELVRVSPGLYQVDWVPPMVDAARDIEITLRGKTPDKAKVVRTWAVSVLPRVSQQLSLVASPPELVLGQDASANLSITLSGGALASRDGGDLIFSASAGTVGALTPMGEGAYSLLYTPPAGPNPGVAVVTVSDRRDPSRTYGAVSIPLLAKRDLPVTGPAGASVLATVGARQFGPVTLDKSGKAKLPIVVAPGAGAAKVATTTAKGTTEKSVDLKLPAVPRLRIVPLPAGLPADAGLAVPVRVFAVTPEGKADPAATVLITTTAGTVSEARHEGNGLYAATFTPPKGNAVASAVLTATLKGGGTVQVDKRTVALTPARPASLTVTATPPAIAPGTTRVMLAATVKDAAGAGLPGRQVAFKIDGGRLDGAIKDDGKGSYLVPMATSGQGPVDLVATVKAPANANPVRRILVFPTRPRLPVDGVSGTLLTILTLDEYGYPVNGVPLDLAVRRGDGSLPKKATTDEAGVAQVYYTTGRDSGLIHIEALAAGQSGGVALMQLPPGVAPGLEGLPLSGPADLLSATAAWAPIVTRLNIPAAP